MVKKLPLNQIVTGDCLKILPTWPDNSVDLVFADPPYNLQLQQELWRPNLTHVDAVDDTWDQFDDFAAYDAFTHAWLTAVRRVMKETATLWVSGTYHNIFRVGAIMQDIGFWLLNTVTWFKPNAMPNFRGTRLKNDVEFVIWAKKTEKGAYTFHHHQMKSFNHGKQLGSVWEIPVCAGHERLRDDDGKKLHSTQKPEELLRRIIIASSSPGNVVVDPFMGSGTTAAMAKHLRRQWIGIEREAAYVEAARARVEQVTPLDKTHPDIAAALRRKPAPVPFKLLLEEGYLQPGQELYLDNPLVTAIILEDGRLKANGFVGSIHKVGAKFKDTPSCNGWMHWRYIDADSGEQRWLNDLRQKIRARR